MSDGVSHGGETGSSIRMKGVTVVKPLVYGTISRAFGKKREDDGHTHTWMCYLRPYENQDMSLWVKRVQFKLHESYTNQVRVFTEPPYEVKETGWGEFEIVIKIFFNDPAERPVTIYHLLKLFNLGDADIMMGRRPLISESYDEVVFQEPTNHLYKLLSDTRKPHDASVKLWQHENDFQSIGTRMLKTLTGAQAEIKQEIHAMNEKLKASKEAIEDMQRKITKAEAEVTDKNEDES